MPPKAPDLDALLHAAVQGIGGVERPGQVQMVHAVADAIAKDEHLLVQAGTGTGSAARSSITPSARSKISTCAPGSSRCIRRRSSLGKAINPRDCSPT